MLKNLNAVGPLAVILPVNLIGPGPSMSTSLESAISKVGNTMLVPITILTQLIRMRGTVDGEEYERSVTAQFICPKFIEPALNELRTAALPVDESVLISVSATVSE